MLVYVDDLFIANNNETNLISLNTTLVDDFKIKYLVLCCFFLGLDIARSSSGITLATQVCTGFIRE